MGLAALAGAALEETLAGAPQAWRDAAALVPVPLHSSRRRERGFNQAELLGAELARRAGIPLLAVLERRRPTLAQVGLTGAERRVNVAGAFRVRDTFTAFCPGRSFLLLDDVLTTGATLEAAAEALVHAGGGPVRAIALARALPGPDA
jgi:ComF family protein